VSSSTDPSLEHAPSALAAAEGRESGGLPTPTRRPAVAVDVVILTVREHRLEVLLIRRDHWPHRGMWAIPGSFVRAGESLEDAARRKLAEEAGVADVYLEQLYTFGEPGRDPRARVITVVYYALLRADQLRLDAGAGAGERRLFGMYHLPELAFDHADILAYTLQRLRGKLEYTTIGFQLLAPEFTLSELQDVYEAILNRRLDKRNFRKKLLITRIVEPTAHTRMGGQHRPAQLYRFNPSVQA
jgi:8-oxo-dGTP diphosphatase